MAAKPKPHPDERRDEQSAVVHQATGVLSVQLDISIDAALERIRTHADTVDKPINEVARDLVNRQLFLT